MCLMILSAAFAVIPLLAPAETGGGGVQDPTGKAPGLVAEIVSFRLTAGTQRAAFLQAAKATEAPLRRLSGFVSRYLTLDDHTGLWIDLVLWTSANAAHAGADAMMADPSFGAFMGMIDGPTVQMSHPRVLWQMD